MATNDAGKNTGGKAGKGGSTPIDKTGEAYDASLDPRTGRPPNPLEAQRLAREHEQERQAGKQTSGDGESDDPTIGAPVEQAPARMTSPRASDDEQAVVDALVEEGIAREEAERLVETHGGNLETLKAVAWTQRQSSTTPGKQ